MKLLEREQALTSLEGWLAEAVAGEGRMVLLGGEAGVGKSSLVRAFVASPPAGTRLLIGACEPLSSPPPLGPLIDIAPGTGERVRSLLGNPARRGELFAVLLDELTAGSPALFVIEDAHWADDATLDLLRFLGRRIGSTRALLLVTYRDDEVGTTHPLRSVVGHLASFPHTRRLPLRPLSKPAVAELAAGTGVDAERLHRLTGGNPFFVTEVLAAGGGDLPETVRDAVLGRAAGLSPGGRELLELVAIAGPRAETWLIAALLPDAGETSRECLDAGLLIQAEGGLGFRHELARNAVLQVISPVRAAELHGRVLAALETRRGQPTALLAHHAGASGNAGAVLRHAPKAALEAEGSGAGREAAALYALALKHAGGLPEDERIPLLAGHATFAGNSGDIPGSIVSLSELVTIHRRRGDTDSEAIWLARLARNLVWNARNQDGEEALARALDLVKAGPSSVAKCIVYERLAGMRMLNRDLAEAIAWAGRARDVARQIGRPDTERLALNALGSALIIAGEIGRGEEALLESRALSEAADDDDGVALADLNLGSAFGEVYRFDKAEPYLEEAIIAAIAAEDGPSISYSKAWLALTHCYLGRWNEATAGATPLIGDHHIATGRIMAAVALGRVRARRGDPEVWAALDLALELAEPTRTLQRLAPVRAARAEAAWLAGRPEQAVHEARAAWELAVAHPHRWLGGELAYWLWKGGATIDVPFPVAEPFALEMAGNIAGAAEAWDALGCPYEAARARAGSDDETELLTAFGAFDRLGARPGLQIVTAHLRAMGSSRIPRGPRSATRTNAAGLTAREMEVLGGIARGLTNAEIADELFLSSKTVEHHVSAILLKLDVTTRRQATANARSLGLIP